MRLYILRPGSIWRVIALGTVAMATVLWASQAFAQYPGGERDPGLMYYCTASGHNAAATSDPGYGEVTCQELLFQVTGSLTQSVNMVGSINVVGGDGHGEFAKLKGYIVPSRGMRKLTIACNVGVQICRDNSGGSQSGLQQSQTGTGFSADGTSWSLLAPVAPSTVGACASNTLDVVHTFRAAAYDNWWSEDVIGDNGTSWRLQASTLDDSLARAATYSCRVIGWEDWPAWLVDNPPWQPPPGSIIGLPTPVPTSTWGVNPWVPVTDTEKMPTFDVGLPGVETCTIVIPGYNWTWDNVEYGWDEIEFCTREQSFTITLFGVDVGAALVTVFILSGVGVLVSIIKRA